MKRKLKTAVIFINGFILSSAVMGKQLFLTDSCWTCMPAQVFVSVTLKLIMIPLFFMVQIMIMNKSISTKKPNYGQPCIWGWISGGLSENENSFFITLPQSCFLKSKKVGRSLWKQICRGCLKTKHCYDIPPFRPEIWNSSILMGRNMEPS